MRPGGERCAERHLLAAAPRALGRGLRADWCDRDAHAVDAELDLVPLRDGGGRLDVDDVLGVERQIGANAKPAARAERQAVDALVLRQLLGELMDVDHDRRTQVADGEPRDLLRRRDIALHDDGRDEQQIGDVVEAARRVIGRQQQLEIELGRQVVEREQVADRMAVLGAREAPERGHGAGLRLRRGGGVELRFEERGRAHISGVLGPRALGRHRLRAQLAHDLFPMLGVGRDGLDRRPAR